MGWEFVEAIFCHVIDIFVIVKLRNDLFCFLQCFRNHCFFKKQIVVSFVLFGPGFLEVYLLSWGSCCGPFIGFFLGLLLCCIFHCYIFLAWQIIVSWLLHGHLSKSNFDVFQVGFKGNRRLYWWNPVRFYSNGCFPLWLPWNMYWRCIRLANCSKSASTWGLISFTLVTGVGINRSSFDSTLTWPSVDLRDF